MASRKTADINPPSKKSSADQALEKDLESLLKRKKYAQALRKLQQASQNSPPPVLSITTAKIWLEQGKNEFQQKNYSQATVSFQESLALDPSGDVYYWLAKCFLARNQQALALNLFQSGFEDKTLPKHLGGCYLKLLCLEGNLEQIEALVKTSSKRFQPNHLHWAKGILALKKGDFQNSLEHFQKMNAAASPGDHPSVWLAYLCQQSGDWPRAAKILPMDLPTIGGRSFLSTSSPHPALEQLCLVQSAYTHAALSQIFDLDAANVRHRHTVWVLELLHLLHSNNYHDAAHLLLDMPTKAMAEYSDLKTLYRPVMLRGGQQARQQGDLDCTREFWGKVVRQPEFDPQLGLQLYQVLQLIKANRQALQLINEVIQWVRKAAKKQPIDWPDSRLNPTLAKLYCWVADTQLSLGRLHEVNQAIAQAEQMDPNHRDVLGRKGLQSFKQGSITLSQSLLTEALAVGCDFLPVYEALLKCLADDPEATKTIRRKYGKRFGDIGVETEVNIPDWVEALNFQIYSLMSSYVNDQEKLSPALKAIQIFLQAAQGEPSASQKISFDISQGIAAWDDLLKDSTPQQQVDILMAIYLVVQQHSRRNQKGVTSLQSRYIQQLSALATEIPAARLGYLTLLPLKTPSPDRLEAAAGAILRGSPEAGKLLAKAQLQLSRFSTSQAFRPMLQAYQQREPQNPLLLLATASLYDRNSQSYQKFYDEGFDIARRLQDAEALQACREEEWFKSQDTIRNTLGNRIDQLDKLNIFDILNLMAKSTFGEELSPDVLEDLLPELLDQFHDHRLDNDNASFPFPPPKRKTSKKSKAWYELF